ncbi:hypothetical protein E8E13_008243 [Curvularia kusanoi]|uniref:Heterokaryon incompatibility domain-containing protein n=1 Tax=Curvularia kusanoi TaxID=90978 RepID=A0A9P4TAV2_CURKU|nr:hypothetical protein E8E13_008243 [Curvularia kusanoi]
MEGQSTTYTYSPLDESRRQIRLLHLLPAGKKWNGAQDGTDDPVQTVMSQAEDIHCTFSIASLDDSEDDSEDDSIEDDYEAGSFRADSFDNDISKKSPVENGPLDDVFVGYDSNKGEIFKDKAEDDVSEDHHVKYEAISYVWGDPNDRKTIYLHGHTFTVTKNLYSALLHMRRTEERILWVDALCINQGDMEERASQVQQMGSVYKQADVVVVYVGEWENAAITFQLIEALGADEDRHHYDAATTQEVLRSFDDDYITFQRWRKCKDKSALDIGEGTYGFQRIVDRMHYKRKLAITTSGYVGLIPEVAEPGDHVVLMPGGRVPYIIRRLEEPYKHTTPDGDSTFTDRFEFMGDCYIHGIMFGEAWDETKLRPIVLA